MPFIAPSATTVPSDHTGSHDHAADLDLDDPGWRLVCLDPAHGPGCDLHPRAARPRVRLPRMPWEEPERDTTRVPGRVRRKVTRA